MMNVNVIAGSVAVQDKYDSEYWQDRIDDIMDNFDFNKVAVCMKALNWGWHSLEGNTPNYFEIKTFARNLLKRKESVATGGFEVKVDKEEGYMSLKFVLTDWDSYEEEKGA